MGEPRHNSGWRMVLVRHQRGGSRNPPPLTSRPLLEARCHPRQCEPGGLGFESCLVQPWTFSSPSPDLFSLLRSGLPKGYPGRITQNVSLFPESGGRKALPGGGRVRTSGGWLPGTADAPSSDPSTSLASLHIPSAALCQVSV